MSRELILDEEAEPLIKMSTVKISTMPSKAQIWVWALSDENDTEDGYGQNVQDVFTGFLTPAIVPVYLGNGIRHFRLKKDGYEDTVFEVMIKENETATVDQRLYALGDGPWDGTLKIVSSPSQAVIDLTVKKLKSNVQDRTETAIESLLADRLPGELVSLERDASGEFIHPELAERIEKGLLSNIRSEVYSSLSDTDYEMASFKPDSEFATPNVFKLPAGIYDVQISKPGYLPVQFSDIRISRGTNIERTAVLEFVSQKSRKELKLW